MTVNDDSPQAARLLYQMFRLWKPESSRAAPRSGRAGSVTRRGAVPWCPCARWRCCLL